MFYLCGLELISNIKISAKWRNNWFYLCFADHKTDITPYIRFPHRKLTVGSVKKVDCFK